MASEYPDTTLRDDVVDPLYGGRPGSEFGGPAWTWAANVLRFLGEAFLTYLRAPHHTLVVTMEEEVSAGDVVVFDASAALVGGAYWCRRLGPSDSGTSTVHFLGVALEPAAAGARCRVATGGILTRTTTGIASLTGGAAVTADYTTARLRAATGGEPVLGYGDTAGNVLLRLP